MAITKQDIVVTKQGIALTKQLKLHDADIIEGLKSASHTKRQQVRH